MVGAVLRASFFLLSGLMLGFAFLLVASQGSLGLAQTTSAITPTTGAGNLGTAVTQAGNTYHITGGTRPGNGPNLFHSFGEFGVPTNNIANFLNETALPTSNILGRVTGGNPSNIFGTIQTTGFGSANLFLMNPAGIVFGPNAALNVGGSATFTTADYLRFADGARFNAMPGPQDAAHLQRADRGIWISGIESRCNYGSRRVSSQWLTERAFHSSAATSRFSQAHRRAEPRNPLDSPHRMARYNWPVPHQLESSTPQHSSRCRT